MAFGLVIVGYGLIFSLVMAAVGGFILFVGVYGWALEPSDDEDLMNTRHGHGHGGPSRACPRRTAGGFRCLTPRSPPEEEFVDEDHHEPFPGLSHPHQHRHLQLEAGACGCSSAPSASCSAALISTYLLYNGRALTGPTPSDVYNIPFTSISSFVLLMSSLTMVLAVSAAHRGDDRRMRLWLITTACLGAVFISGQVYEFTQMYRRGPRLHRPTSSARASTRSPASTASTSPSASCCC